mgnify:CR=1 FL=1
MAFVKNNTRRLTECALLTAFAVILDLSSLIPGLGFITILLCALPATYIAMVHGMRYALASTAAAATILSLSYGPHEGLAYLSLFAATGLALGWLARRGSTPATILVGATIVVFISMCLNVYILEALVGIPSSERLADGIKEGLIWMAKEWAALIHSFGWTATATPPASHLASIELFMAAPLTLFLVMAFLVVYANYLAAALVFFRLGLPWEPVPDPRKLQAPKWLAICVVIDLLISTKTYLGTSGIPALIGANILFLGYAVVFLSGLSLVIGMMDRKEIFHPAKRLAIMVVFLGFYTLTIIAGALDSFADFRQLHQE